MSNTQSVVVEEQLLKWRTKAAEASRGISTSAVVSATLEVILRKGKTGDMLEYGAGAAVLLRQLIDNQWRGRLTGADLLPRPAEIPGEVEWCQADLNKPLDCDESSFDLIVSTEVIEHLENPRAVAREFARLLRPGGRLILTTPNQESIRSLLSLLIAGHFVFFQDSCYPAHITALLKKDLERIFMEAGFCDIRFYYIPSGGIPKFPHVTWQQISFGLLSGCLFSDNILMEAFLP